VHTAGFRERWDKQTSVRICEIDVVLCKTDNINTLRTGDADLRFYVTTVQDG